MYYLLFIFLSLPLMAQEGPAAPSPTPDGSAALTSAAEPPASLPPEKNKISDEDIIPLPPNPGAAETPMVSGTDVPPAGPAGTAGAIPDAAFADPNSVIPGDEPSISPPALGPSSDEIKRKGKIRYKEVRTEVEKDPAVRSLREQAQSAKSFEDERAALREYYRLLFKKMKKVDKSISDRCDLMERSYLERLAQSRLEPTIPLNLPPVAEPLGD